MSNNPGRWIAGGFLILLGLGFIANQLGINTWGISVWDLWPVILILVGLSMLQKRNTLGGLIVLFLGIIFLVSTITNYSFIGMFWPVILIAIGISFIIKPRGTHLNNSTRKSSEDSIDDSYVFWGGDKKLTSQNFKGGSINCAFGGFKIDLRDVKISPEGGRLTINCAFGGGEILVAKDANVEVTGDAVFGGWDNKSDSHFDNSLPKLTINGSVFFGGVEIK
jgi:predicted membrane protein